MLDIEITKSSKAKLYMLPVSGRETDRVCCHQKIAVDMVGEKLISQKEALLRIEPDQLNQLLRPIFDSTQKKKAIRGR